MNIFVLDEDPVKAAQAMDCVRVPKMVTESAQMMASALRRHGATDEQMPLTKSGTPYKGGYAHHPCTVWAGDTFGNFSWLSDHANALLVEYTWRFNKEHACANPISQLWHVGIDHVDDDDFNVTPFALAMPDEYRPTHGTVTLPTDDGKYIVTHAIGQEAIDAYRRYYHTKTFARWEKGTPAPNWWQGVIA